MTRRVVVTGLGVVAPNGNGTADFELALRKGQSGLRYNEQMEAAKVSGFYGSPYPIPIPALEHLARDSRRIADHMTTMRVSEIMSRDVKSVGPEDDVEAVARMMAAAGYHRVPVLDGTDLVGIVTSLDIVRLVGEVGLGPC